MDLQQEAVRRAAAKAKIYASVRKKKTEITIETPEGIPYLRLRF